MQHKPVLVRELLTCLALKPGMTVVDGTLGSAGHALEILKVIGPEGRYLGLDQDPASIARCREFLKDFPQVSIFHKNFLCIPEVLENLNIPAVDAVILDVGMSSDQLEDGSRGFSFDRPGPLDMRMNPESTVTAQDLIRRYSEKDLAKLFFDYGQERFANRFARAICQQRKTQPIETTGDLVRVIEQAMPRGARAPKGKRPAQRYDEKGEARPGGMHRGRPPWARKSPATRVFQALRIAVNDELGVLERAIPEIWKHIKPGGRFAVISFHSLEDRIVKLYFREWHRAKLGRLVTPKPLEAAYEEVKANRRARSAKLRVVEKIGENKT